MKSDKEVLERRLKSANSEQDRLMQELAAAGSKLADVTGNYDRIKKEHEELLGELWTWQQITHHVIFDGPKYCGKSTLIMRWANPTIPFKVDGFKATQGVASVPMHLCSELDRTTRTERRHQVQFHDVAGEEAQYIASVFKSNRPEVAILVIDPTRLSESKERFTTHLLKIIYGDPDIVAVLKGVLIYISKCADAEAAGTLQEAVKFAEGVQSLLSAFHRASGEVHVLCGDARTNQGIVDALGFVATRMDLQNLLPKHPSAT